MTHDEIKAAVKLLKANPIGDYWKPKNIGEFTAQRIEANQLGCRMYLLGQENGLDDLYCYGTGCVYLQLSRVPNTHWLNESGYTYMVWKD